MSRARLPARRSAAWASRLGVALGALSLAASAAAHDFWVQPAQFWSAPHAAIPLTLQVGHGPSRQRSPIPLSRIVRFAAIGPDGRASDLRGRLRLGGNADDGDVSLQEPGAHVLVLQTDNRAQSHLPADRYNAYLKDEGLTPALAFRARAHRTQADGSEIYSRQAKALVQVGPAGAQAQVTRPLGLPLEIVPELSPYAVPRPAVLPVRVIFRGRPLVGALVKLTDLEHDAAPLETRLTDRQGRASFAMPARGAWLLNVIWTRPLTRSPDTDFETIFSSLSFGFPTGGA